MSGTTETSESDVTAGGIVCVASSHIVIADQDSPCDPTPYLRINKLRKYMGKQDDLAVYAACTALNRAGLSVVGLSGAGLRGCIEPDRFGLYLAVGYIPFEEHELNRLCEAANDQGRFSMRRLSTTGFHAVNGLMTFRCLPNMPAFHVSTNLGIRGPSFVTYPGAGQFYVALQQACYALEDGQVDVALVMGVADQRNFLVRHHLDRMPRAVARRESSQAVDAAGCFILQRSGDSAPSNNGTATLCELHLDYQPLDPFRRANVPDEIVSRTEPDDPEVFQTYGPAALAVHLSRMMESRNRMEPSSENGPTEFRHRITTHDGITAGSRWEVS
ncbi:MAG: hypothetical protein KDB00_17765 [Planctomycetales bacterium]|nr:hypothetical protein [Planctomycetales bacterium]